MKQIHLVKFSSKIIETTVTDEASDAEDWVQNINKLLKQHGGIRIIGMGCKFIRHPIMSMSNNIALLLLCFDTKCLVLQLLHMDSIPQCISGFLRDSRTTFVGNEIQENSLKLQEEYALGVNRKVDVHFLAKRCFPVSYKGRPSMRALAYGIVRFSKRKCSIKHKIVGDWESRVLDTELVARASVDAHASYSIAHKLLKDECV